METKTQNNVESEIKLITNFPEINFFITTWDSEIFSANLFKNFILRKIFDNFWNNFSDDKNKNTKVRIIEKAIIM